MTGISQIERCGGCHFGKMFAQDFTKRMCWGMPPSTQLMPAPNGQVSLRMLRPVVNVSDEACGMYRAKSAVDKINDVQAMQAVQAMAEQGVSPAREVDIQQIAVHREGETKN